MAVGLLIRIVVQPIQRLTAGVRAMGDGKEQRLEEAGFEEIDAIARAFNEVTGKFRDCAAHARRAGAAAAGGGGRASRSSSRSCRAHVPEMSGFEIGTLYRAAKEVGGDYYDFVQVGDEAWGRGGRRRLRARACPASMVMTMIRTALRMEARGERAASEVMDRR